ncbi:pyruvate kinase [Exilibacterium tricleocarpae]|uniref:Pyruvate kinase n=1 Tax=Exilibacterium tricleocarpae TaxID=2591008 RepID=A0A545SPU4_9GAMM|nr:pyruvate kinase [Exilibacterium tricleocarpae]TQV67000.1 pyruvate kinase [Exilibacterium tricleocarpae]
MRKTKIICTIGPATSSYDMLARLHEAGLDVVRLNMSHGDHDSHAKVIKAIRTLNKKVNRPVSIMMDTQGPEIRTGDLHSDLDLKTGEVISIVARSVENVEETSIAIHYDDLIEDVGVGERITVDNGLINLEVLEKNDRVMQCRIIDGGVLKSKRHVNLPGIRVNLPAITEKDKLDIAFAIEQQVDFIALSFVREAQDIRQLRELLGERAGKIKIIAKIEDQEGVRNVTDIIREADGVMVARGDLGVEVHIHDLPNIQRNIVRLCSTLGKRVIVATHLLESMIENPIPTRAEVTDVANAVYEEVDAIMLSGETTVGKHPIKCVRYLDQIAQASEKTPGLRFTRELIRTTDKQHIAAAAVELADSLHARGIVVITRRGLMANYVTNCHPEVPILAFTNDGRTRRQLTLNRNLRSFRLAFSSDPEKTLAGAFAILLADSGFTGADKVVVISDILSGTGIDAIQIRELGKTHPAD